MQIVSLEDNLREMPNPLFSGEKKEYSIQKAAADFFTQPAQR